MQPSRSLPVAVLVLAAAACGDGPPLEPPASERGVVSRSLAEGTLLENDRVVVLNTQLCPSDPESDLRGRIQFRLGEGVEGGYVIEWRGAFLNLDRETFTSGVLAEIPPDPVVPEFCVPPDPIHPPDPILPPADDQIVLTLLDGVRFSDSRIELSGSSPVRDDLFMALLSNPESFLVAFMTAEQPDLVALAGQLGHPGPLNFGEALVGWWRFDDRTSATAIDESGLGNHGALVGAAAHTSDALLGAAVDVTGSSGHVTVPHDPSLEPATGTIQAWIKVPALKNADVVSKVTLCFVRTEPCTEPFGRSVIGLRVEADGGASAFVANDDPLAPGPWTTAAVPSGAIAPATWHHLAMRWDGAVLTLFVDGLPQATAQYDPVPGTGLSYFDGTALRFGAATAWPVPGDREFIGQIDDVRYYARARADAEIFADYITQGHKPAQP